MSCYSWLCKIHHNYYNIQLAKWMSWGKFNTFTLVVSNINKSGVPCHIIARIFEVQKAIKTNMVLQVKDLLCHFNLCDKVIAYVKDKGTNLNILTNSLTIIVSCVPLILPQPYDICWQMLWTLYSNVVKTLLMMWKFFHEGNINQRCTNIFVKKIDMDKKKEKKGNNGKELVEMHLFPLKVKHSCQYFFCIQSYF
jgi:hypothetical protein